MTITLKMKKTVTCYYKIITAPSNNGSPKSVITKLLRLSVTPHCWMIFISFTRVKSSTSQSSTKVRPQCLLVMASVFAVWYKTLFMMSRERFQL